jgi:hypothetical protein
MKREAEEHFELAKRHLEKVQQAWDDPTDWADLAIYGFYCLEQAIMAAAASSSKGKKSKRQHREKVQLARALHKEQGLPDVSELLQHLHKAQKYASYGDSDTPSAGSWGCRNGNRGVC